MRRVIPHAVGAAVAVGVACAFTVLAYLFLLAVAIVTGSGPGGPLALPFAVLAALLGSGVSSLFVLLPAVWVARRTRPWPWRPLVAVAVVGIESAGVALLWTGAVGRPRDTLVAWLVLCALQLPLLGAYWLAVSFADGLLRGHLILLPAAYRSLLGAGPSSEQI